MTVLELFAGTRSIGKAFEARGHKVFSVDWDKSFKNITLYADIGALTAADIINLCGGVPDVIWASPDCSTFSVAAISKHRRQNKETGSLDPISDYAKFCDTVDQNVLQLIKDLQPQLYFIENPVGAMRKMEWIRELPAIPLLTVSMAKGGKSQQIFGRITRSPILSRLAKGAHLATMQRREDREQERKR